MHQDDFKVGSRVTIGQQAFPRGEGTVTQVTPHTVTVRLDNNGETYLYGRSAVHLATHS